MTTKLPFGPPLPVSPLIRGIRWGLFFAGFIYAQGKQRLYNALEANFKEKERKRKIIRDQELAVIKARIAAEEKEFVKMMEKS